MEQASIEQRVSVHHGRNFKRLREARGVKQAAVAVDLGTSQQMVSEYEYKRVLDDEVIGKLAAAIQVPVDLIRQLEEDPTTIVIENNTFEEGSVGSISGDFDCVNSYNPVDKILELATEKEALLERLLKLEQERNAELRNYLQLLNDLRKEFAEFKGHKGI